MAAAIVLCVSPACAQALSTDADRTAPQKPDVREQYLANMQSRTQSQISSAVASLRMTASQLAGGLHVIVLNLLKKVPTMACF